MQAYRHTTAPRFLVLVKRTTDTPFAKRCHRSTLHNAKQAAKEIERRESNYAVITMDERDWNHMNAATR